MKSFRKPAPLGFTRTTAYFCRLNEGYEKPMKEISSKISKVLRKLRKIKENIWTHRCIYKVKNGENASDLHWKFHSEQSEIQILNK